LKYPIEYIKIKRRKKRS